MGRYRVVARLGRGGYATVWRAHDTLLGRDVALKILDERVASSIKARRRFLHEAQATAALDHPGIVAVHDSGESDGHVYIALSLIDGETLSDRIARRLLSFDDAVRIVCAAAEALGHAHERDVVHRDVTSRNIMIARDGRVIVLDFGLALAAWESRVTSTETTLGTAYYMAPEVMKGGEADPRSDLYGLGVVLYEALTGAFPFVGEQPQAVFYSAMNLDPTPPSERRPELPPELERVVLKAIAREPGERHQTARVFGEALRAASTSEMSTPISRSSAPASIRPAGGVAAAVEASRDDSRPVPSAPLYLAVLPFEADGPPADPEGMCAVIAGRLGETVRAALSRSSGVRVVPVGLAERSTPTREVARELGANVLLSGSVRRIGTRLRVAFSMVDPWRSVVIGGGVIDGSALQTFDMEDDVVASVTGILGLAAADSHPRSTRPPDPAAQERYRQALGYLRSYDNEASVDGAIALLERLIASEGETAPYQAALARASLYKHRLTRQRIWENRAASACKRAQELGPGRPETRLAVGHLRSVCGQHDSALAEFASALELAPGSVDAMLGAARALRELARFQEAERLCLRAIAAEPGDWRGHNLLGWIHSRSGEYERALEPFRRVVELAPERARGQRDLGSAYFRLDRMDEAMIAYRASISLEPDDEAYSNLGTTLYYLGRREESIAALRKATELAPLDPVRWGNLGNAYHWLGGNDNEAVLSLQRAIGLMRERLELNPGMGEWWARLAGWLANLGQRDDAAGAIAKAVELAPEDVRCMAHAGRVYFQLGDREACFRWLWKARRAGGTVGDLRRSPVLAALRDDPEFQRLLSAPVSRQDSPGSGGQSRSMKMGANGKRRSRPGAARYAAPVPEGRDAEYGPRRLR